MAKTLATANKVVMQNIVLEDVTITGSAKAGDNSFTTTVTSEGKNVTGFDNVIVKIDIPPSIVEVNSSEQVTELQEKYPNGGIIFYATETFDVYVKGYYYLIEKTEASV